MARFGKWDRGESLGEGGQGRIFFATDTTGEFQGQYVLKILKNIDRKELFEREIRAVLRLNHPNILTIVDYDISTDRPYYVAEYCDGKSIDTARADEFKGNIRQVVSVLVPITEALEAANAAGIVHRDVKPQNILQRKGTAVIADFGICHVEGDERITLTDEGMGAVNYIAPEMESGSNLGGPTPKTDVYSLAKVVYWMLSGGRIFARENHRNNSLTNILGEQRYEHIHMLFDRTLREKPEERISLAEFRDGLIQAAALIDGDYAPLKLSIGIKCRFCGQGTYSAGPPPSAGELGIHNMRTGTYGMAVTALHCTKCGHLEFFMGRPEWWKE